MKQVESEKLINALDPGSRQVAISALAWDLSSGRIKVPEPGPAVNVHLHTFFSFNAEGFSPSGIAWEARKQGLSVVGSVDFDVLDAMDEIFTAGDALNLRTVAAFETRVFMDTYAERDINSPGEPGVSYFMGTGFTRLPEKGSAGHAQLQAMRETAQTRNRALLSRLADHINPVILDYDADIVSLTPAGNATERHMLEALDHKAQEIFPDLEDLIGYWARVLGLDIPAIKSLIDSKTRLRNAIRGRLMKRGGIGYVKPDASTFPPVTDVIAMIRECEAIACATWLDGTSAGETDADKLLDDYLDLGCLALNIIPDRNWNIADPEKKRVKVENLGRIVAAARKRDLVLSVGTEMNSYGQKFVDTFDAPEMQPFAGDFRNGAYILYGHTILQRACGKGMTSAWADATFARDRGRANAFYLEVGEKAFPPKEARQKLMDIDDNAQPEQILKILENI